MRFGGWGPFAEGGISAQLQKTRLRFAAGASSSNNQLYRHRVTEEAANDGVKSGDNGKWRRMQKGEPILIIGRWLIQEDTKPSLSRVDTKVTKRGRNSDSTDKQIGSRILHSAADVRSWLTSPNLLLDGGRTDVTAGDGKPDSVAYFDEKNP